MSEVGLGDAAERRTAGYSKGMGRRLSLAAALIGDPDLLILDEPTSGLDPLASAEMKEKILEVKRNGKTVLFSSHLLADVSEVCDRIVVFDGPQELTGRILPVTIEKVDAFTLFGFLPPGEGIKRSAGAWADGGEELDSWLEQVQRSRQQDRPEMSP